MRSPCAYIRVTCDRCQTVAEEVELTTTARGYDERNVDEQLKQWEWRVEDGQDICPICIEAEEVAE